ncbi:hypothetical protein IFM89_010602 [Coptis chinensis]|uniref:Uncharacterized protein n=1 Tax=Coptis chinensis TaxID=261450 RepID=A0A835ILK9_9MAGN|nr:hypothetical protein IFM89_010602 [Coptis chinensis]
MVHTPHTSSTVSGSVVVNASFFRYAPGTATRIAPKSRIVVYKYLDHLFSGVSLYSGLELPNKRFFPLVYARSLSNGSGISDAAFCRPGQLNPKLVEGKIVVCK